MRRLRFIKKNTITASATTTKPPIIPPTIGPVFDFLDEALLVAGSKVDPDDSSAEPAVCEVVLVVTPPLGLGVVPVVVELVPVAVPVLTGVAVLPEVVPVLLCVTVWMPPTVTVLPLLLLPPPPPPPPPLLGAPAPLVTKK